MESEAAAVGAVQKAIRRQMESEAAAVGAVQKAIRRQMESEAAAVGAMQKAIRRQMESEAAAVGAMQKALRQQVRVPRTFGIDLDALRSLRAALPATSSEPASSSNRPRRSPTACVGEDGARERAFVEWATERLRMGWVRNRSRRFALHLPPPSIH